MTSEPSKAPHFSWAKDGEVIIQITGVGPSGKIGQILDGLHVAGLTARDVDLCDRTGRSVPMAA
jgi:hypothetical protein